MTTGQRILGILEFAFKFVVVLAIVGLVLRLVPTGGGTQNALGEAISGIFRAIGQIDDIIRDIRATSGV